MRRSALTIGLVGVVLLVLVALNVAFMSRPRESENEQNGDRSSYRATPYGTLAYFTLLQERGYTVERLEEPYTALGEKGVSTLLVVVPHLDAQPTEEELSALEQWVSDGGNLVVVDREVNLETKMGTFTTAEPLVGEPVAKTPSVYTRGVLGLKVTEYATRISDASRESVVHFAAANGAMMIDKPYGEGHVTFLTEPYVLQNNGIGEKDNAVLALNLADGIAKGTIAFDEYHHGHGHATASTGGDGLRGYIAGTPVPWIVAQIGLVALVIAITAGARFARPIPLASASRTSALEFVSSMANIQRLARASDLAIENVYTSFRARLCRYANVPSDSTPRELARAAAARGRVDGDRLLALVERCERVLAERSQPPAAELLELVTELREIEGELRL